jgi:hypothetical protein
LLCSTVMSIQNAIRNLSQVIIKQIDEVLSLLECSAV